MPEQLTMLVTVQDLTGLNLAIFGRDYRNVLHILQRPAVLQDGDDRPLLRKRATPGRGPVVLAVFVAIFSAHPEQSGAVIPREDRPLLQPWLQS
jgi:hypothetical protein